MAFQITGSLISKSEVILRGQTNFPTREFAINTGGEYPQIIGMQCVREMCRVLDDIPIGKTITCNFNLRGTIWQDKVITNVHCWKIEGFQAKADPIPNADGVNNSDSVSRSTQNEEQNPDLVGTGPEDGLPF
mgnify:CR=1 FL=1